MDKHGYYNKDINYNPDIEYDKHINLNYATPYDQINNDKKSFSQRLGEANVMPTGMLDPVSNTDLAILSILRGDTEIKD